MGALENSSYSSLWLTLGGIILVVGFALGLSLLQDGLITMGNKRLNSEEINEALRDGRIRIRELDDKAVRLQRRKELNTTRHAIEAQRVELRKTIALAKSEIPHLERSLVEQKEATRELEEKYGIYRRRARSLLWVRAEGRSLGKITNPSGGFFEDAFISDINPEGINIRHRSGSALLSIHQIPAELLKEFDLNPREALEVRTARIKAEAARRRHLEKSATLKKVEKVNSGSIPGSEIERFFNPKK